MKFSEIINATDGPVPFWAFWPIVFAILVLICCIAILVKLVWNMADQVDELEREVNELRDMLKTQHDINEQAADIMSDIISTLDNTELVD